MSRRSTRVRKQTVKLGSEIDDVICRTEKALDEIRKSSRIGYNSTAVHFSDIKIRASDVPHLALDGVKAQLQARGLHVSDHEFSSRMFWVVWCKNKSPVPSPCAEGVDRTCNCVEEFKDERRRDMEVESDDDDDNDGDSDCDAYCLPGCRHDLRQERRMNAFDGSDDGIHNSQWPCSCDECIREQQSIGY